MGGEVFAYLQEKGTTVTAAPPKHQNENGLVEQNWRTIDRMARSWLSAALLSIEFWYHAVKRAADVSN